MDEETVGSNNVSAKTIYSLVQGDGARVEQHFHLPARGLQKPQLVQADIRDFTGRSQPIAAVKAALQGAGQAVAISAVAGLGGVGKSALAVHVAWQLADQFCDGTLFWDLRGQSESPENPVTVLLEWLRQLGYESDELPVTQAGLAAWYRSCVAGRKLLVILDNVRDAAQVQDLFPGHPSCGVIVTSRSPVAIDGVVPYRLEVMEQAEALDLLRKMLGEGRVAAELAASERLVELCGYLPLAIRLVGALLMQKQHWQIQDRVAELAVETTRLDLMALEHRSVRASFELSYRALDQATQQMVSRVAVLRGKDFGVALGASLAATDERAARGLLEQLETAQLLEATGAGRFSFHDLVRLFAREKLPADQQASLTQTALDWYTTHSTQMDQQLRLSQATAFIIGNAWFQAEWLNLLEAIEWAGEVRQSSAAVALFLNVQVFAMLQGFRTAELLIAGGHALSAATVGNDRLGEANTLKAIGDVLQFLDQRTDALERYESAMAIYRQVGDRLGEANTLKAIGDVLQFLDQRTDALERYESAMAIYRQVGDRLGEANTLKAIGDVLQFLDQRTDALERYESAMAIYRQVGDRLGEANTLRAIGDVLQFLDQRTDALERYESAMAIYRQVGARLGEANTLKAIGDVLQFLDQRTDALERYESAMAIYRQVGDRLGEANTLRAIGDVLQFLKQSRDALERYESAMAIYRQVGARLGEANTLQAIGDVLQFLDQRTDALERYESAMAIYRQVGARLGEANTLQAIGDVLQFLDQRTDALERYESAMAIYRQVGDRLGEANTLKAIGDVLQFLDQRTDALERYESAMAIYRQVGARLGEANTLKAIGDVLQFLDQRTDALERYESAMAIYRQVGDRLGEANTLQAIGDVLQFLDQRTDALERYESAMAIYRQVGARLGEANTLQAIGDVLQFLDQRTDALERYESAMAIYRQVGARLGEANTLKAIGELQEDANLAMQHFELALAIYQQIGDLYSQARVLTVSIAPAQLKLNQAYQAKLSYEKALEFWREIGYESGIQYCQTALQTINQPPQDSSSTVASQVSAADSADQSTAAPKLKKSFPYWQTAIVLLVGWFLYQTFKPQPPQPAPASPPTQNR